MKVTKETFPKEWDPLLLSELVEKAEITLDRGEVISSIMMASNPGNYPVYSSSAKNNGLMGFWGNYQIDEELITWSVDGGGYLFYRPKHKFSVTNVCGMLRANKDKFNIRYLHYLLEWQHSLMTFDYVDKAHPSVIRKRYLIPKIGKAEQDSIATILSTLDRAIASTEQLIAKYQRIKTGLLHDLLTRGIDEHGNLRSEKTHKFKDSKLGRIPVEWECKKIGSLIAYLGSGITPRGGSKIYKKEGILLIRSQNVYPGYFELDDVAFIDEEINNTMLRSEIFEYDVLLNITGASIGRCVYVPEGFYKANVNQHVCAIRLQNKTENKASFLQAFLNSIYGQNQIIRFNAGGNREGLNYSQIKAMELPWPNNEQEFERIRIIIEKADKYLNANQNNLTKLQYLKAGLMQDLLSGKVRI